AFSCYVMYDQNLLNERCYGKKYFKLKQCIQKSPRNPEQKIIKRVIALEGDIIKTIGYKKKYVKVPHGHIWVEGDHHGHSFDSNAFGPVSLGLLHARATHILWPPQRWQKLQPMLPPERKPLQREQE
uniref:Mitochondrial inner membrane protease subunit 2 n=1 Tax=Catharus ustulatus TaxID=91951 RepID=A0A8C3TZB6_CATUS